ncbi:50S ribosomal protein L21e [Candidatus Micrarchaeota archaeon]|nr:50S ribosomal protein L21e [Candidatus Micrarchaeota archaeon]MBI5176766.1 50S ribosomal protein L21e [Candidatus Micrarchaeota archaeon]
MKRSSGPNSKHSRNLRAKGRQTPAKALEEFAQGALVRLTANTRTKNGRPHLRFNKQIGVILGRQGRSYRVLLKAGGKEKTLVISGAHLSRISAAGIAV